MWLEDGVLGPSDVSLRCLWLIHMYWNKRCGAMLFWDHSGANPTTFEFTATTPAL
jgi:hypothetical protein